MVTAPQSRAPAPQDAAARKNAPRDESGSQQQRPADALDRLQRWSATVAAGAGEALPWVHRGAAVGQAGSTVAREILALVRGMHGGKEYDPEWGRRMRGEGAHAEMIAARFRVAARRLGLDRRLPPLRRDLFRVPGRAEQLDLF